MREYSATVGATDGNIIAAIITTHTPRNQPSVPRLGPRAAVHPAHLGRPSTTSRRRRATNSSATSPSRARAAANAGASPPAGSAARAPRRSRGQAAQENSDVESPVLPSYSMPKALIRERFASAIVRFDADRMEHAVEPNRLAGLDAERHDVLDLEVDRVADADAVAQPVVDDLDRRPLDAEHLARRAARAPPSGRRAARRRRRRACRSARRVARSSTNTPSRQFPSVMTFGVSAIAATLRPPTSVPSISPSRMLKTSVDAAEVVRGAVVERQVARAHQLARAGLDVAALEAPGHDDLPLGATDDAMPRRASRQPSAWTGGIALRSRFGYTVPGMRVPDDWRGDRSGS